MDSSKVLSLLETLDDEIDDLEEALSPLLKAALSETSSKLPLLDKAKLYVLVTYAIESMLFCESSSSKVVCCLMYSLAYLRLNGVKAREHPVFIELTRVKQYFDKIKAAETPVAERNMAVDKAAAVRFIKAGLVSQHSIHGILEIPTRTTTNTFQSGNDKYDLERAEQQAKERAKAHIRFEQESKETPPKRKADEVEEANEDSDSSESDLDSSSDSSGAEPEEAPPAPVVHKKKKQKTDTSDSAPTSGNSTPQGTSKKARAKAAKKAKKEKLKAKRERKKQKRSSEK
jgi:exosome complex protein LRP1